MKEQPIATLIFLMFAGGGIAQVAPTGCGAAVLTGLYGVQRNGHNTTGTLISSIGVVKFDGVGRLTGRESVSKNGSYTKTTIDNAYTINADCTGTVNDSNGAAIFTIVVGHDGEEAFGMSLVAGTTEAVHYERVFDSPRDDMPQCTLPSFTGTYTFQRNGRSGQNDLLAIGVLTSEGLGNATASQTIGRNGVFSPAAATTGAYTIEPDCMGAFYDGTGAVFAEFTLVHDGSQVLGMSETAGVANNIVIHYERVHDPQPRPLRSEPCPGRVDRRN